MAKDKDKAEKLKFTKKDVILYPNNHNPGKIKFSKDLIIYLNIYVFASNGPNSERRHSKSRRGRT